jgi:hypothetical protein
MTTLQFLTEWTLRSSILILSGALLLVALRVKDSSTRLAAWTAMLCGSLAIPALTAWLPNVPVVVMHVQPRQVDAPVVARSAGWQQPRAEAHSTGVPKQFDWTQAVLNTAS